MNKRGDLLLVFLLAALSLGACTSSPTSTRLQAQPQRRVDLA